MNRRSIIVTLAALGLLWFTLSGLAGCSAETRQKILPIFFDGVPREGELAAPPPTRRIRRDLLREIEELKRALKEAQETAKAKEGGTLVEEPRRPAEKAKTWGEATEALPKDAAGYVDWVQAIKAGAIGPRPGLDPKAAEQAVLELDADLSSSPSKLFSVTFSHRAHTQWLTCGNCHPAIFPLRRQAEPTVVTMAKIKGGQYCGTCHSRVAFGPEGRCARCHAKIPAKADWRPKEEARKPIERATNWAQAAKHLPVTAGTPDWSKALAEGVIAPRPGVDAKAADQPVFPLDVERVPASGKMFKAIFPHAAHTALLKCDSCHPAIFQMARRTTPINMGLIYAGQACGVCHGKVAFDARTVCNRCHTEIPAKADWRPAEQPRNAVERARTWDEAAKLLPATAGAPDWTKALAEGVIAPRSGVDPKAADEPVFPLDVERVGPGGEAFKVVFPHQAHTALLKCDSCHPAIFQMARGTTPINMGLIYAGQACGACHGKVAFPVTACGRCHPAMAAS